MLKRTSPSSPKILLCNSWPFFKAALVRPRPQGFFFFWELEQITILGTAKRNQPTKKKKKDKGQETKNRTNLLAASFVTQETLIALLLPPRRPLLPPPPTFGPFPYPLPSPVPQAPKGSTKCLCRSVAFSPFFPSLTPFRLFFIYFTAFLRPLSIPLAFPPLLKFIGVSQLRLSPLIFHPPPPSALRQTDPPCLL